MALRSPTVVALALMLALVGACGRQEVPAGKKIVRVWHAWGEPTAEGFRKAREAYQRKHPEVDLRAVYATNDLATNQRLFTAVAGNIPPRCGSRGGR
jgi:ABC-type glycerol-3-phosphate transport system substrate-binding protein